MATFEFKLPDLGEGVVEGEIVKWLVKPGDSIEEDQGVVELMTDKATVTVPAPSAGRVVSVHGKEGEIAKVHHAWSPDDGDLGDALAAAAVGPGGIDRWPGCLRRGAMAARAVDAEKVLATPVTRRMAREHGLDLAAISGSGPQGRVLKADVQAALEISAVRPSR